MSRWALVAPPAEFVKYIKVIWIWLKVEFCNSPVRYSPCRSAWISRYNRATIPPITLCFTVRILRTLLYERHVLISSQTFGPQLSPTLRSKQYLWLNLCHQHVCRNEMTGQCVSAALHKSDTKACWSKLSRAAVPSDRGKHMVEHRSADDVMVECMHNYIDRLVLEHLWHIH